MLLYDATSMVVAAAGKCCAVLEGVYRWSWKNSSTFCSTSQSLREVGSRMESLRCFGTGRPFFIIFPAGNFEEQAKHLPTHVCQWVPQAGNAWMWWQIDCSILLFVDEAYRLRDLLRKRGRVEYSALVMKIKVATPLVWGRIQFWFWFGSEENCILVLAKLSCKLWQSYHQRSNGTSASSCR